MYGTMTCCAPFHHGHFVKVVHADQVLQQIHMAFAGWYDNVLYPWQPGKQTDYFTKLKFEGRMQALYCMGPLPHPRRCFPQSPKSCTMVNMLQQTYCVDSVLQATDCPSLQVSRERKHAINSEYLPSYPLWPTQNRLKCRQPPNSKPRYLEEFWKLPSWQHLLFF